MTTLNPTIIVRHLAPGGSVLRVGVEGADHQMDDEGVWTDLREPDLCVVESVHPMRFTGMVLCPCGRTGWTEAPTC